LLKIASAPPDGRPPTSKRKSPAQREPIFQSAVDIVDRTIISGWAYDSSQPGLRVTILIRANDEPIGRVVADGPREDLKHAGIGDGAHAFSFNVAGRLAADQEYVVDVTRVSDGARLGHSPILLEVPAAAPPSTQSASALGPLTGCLDSLSRTRMTGWAMEEGNNDHHVGLVVTANGRLVSHLLANRFRQDLKDAGLGDGRHGFDILLPELSALVTHQVHIRRQADGAELAGSPVILPAATAFDADTERSFAALLADLDRDTGEDRALAFLVQQTELLISRRADRDSSRAARQAQGLYRRRWGTLATDDPVTATFAAAPAARALVIDDNVPVAGRDAGSVAILSHIRALRALGYEVGFVAARAMEHTAKAKALEEAEAISCYAAPFYFSVEDILKRQAGSFNVVYLHRLSNAADYLGLVRTHQPKARIVYAVADLHHLRLARQGEVQQRPELVEFSRHLAFREFTMARLADAVITHSPVEARMLAEKMKPTKVHVVPWAVLPKPCAIPFVERIGIAVIGQFGHPPNPDAVFWLIRNVMPLVWAQDPAIPCLIVGHGWTPGSIAGSDSRVEVIGPVDDLADIFARVRLTVAPLRFGAGIKGKVLESFAAGIPCVMSPIAAEGITLPAPLPDLVADGAQSMARIILEYHSNAEANRAAEEAGLALIARETTEERVIETMSKAIPAA
jgi:glycosyltransferase involved in cell wall biosynthesis